MNKLLILTPYAKFGLNSWRNNDITIKLLITEIFGCRATQRKLSSVQFNLFHMDIDVTK